MNYAYVRVSTLGQNLDNQKLEIQNYCKLHNITNVKYIGEKISGTKKVEDRKLGELLSKLQEGDTLLITELSRLGRKIRSIQKTISLLLDKKIKCIAIKENLNIGEDIMSQCLIFCFSISAQIERDLLSERVKMGLQRARLEGKHVGRMKNCKPSYYKLDCKKSYIKKQIKNNISLNKLSKELNVKWSTLRNFCDRNHIKYKNRKLNINRRTKYELNTVTNNDVIINTNI